MGKLNWTCNVRRPDEKRPLIDVTDDAGRTVVSWQGFDDSEDFYPADIAIRNGRMIAAAPDALEACRAMLADYESGKSIPVYEVREMCRRAIAKSNGVVYR